jgi:thiol-disulfide isomerase/thioredoxin
MFTMSRFLHFIKPIALTLLVIGFLQLTGLWGRASATTQMLVMKTGILNVDAEENNAPSDFDYSFTIKDLAGNKISVDQYKGKVLFLNMWATWCGPCKAEMPGIQSLSDKLKGHNIEFLMLSVDKDAALPKVKSYLENNQYTFPVFMPTGNLPEELQVPSIPTTFVISKEGKILMKEVGTRNYDTHKMVKFLKDQSIK